MKPEGLGNRLRRLRQDRELSIEDVARKLGVSSSTYREWENGRSIRGEPYVRMRDLFQISLEELMTGKRGEGSRVLGQIDSLENHVKSLREEILKIV